MKNFFFEKSRNLASTSRLKTVCFEETYGRHILKKITRDISIDNVLDIGCGEGLDLNIIHNNFPNCNMVGVDFNTTYFDKLREKKINPQFLNIENQKLPYENEKFDFIIANQVFEHTKELFWINHEIFRVLKTGGHFFLGVPNGLALHNRLLANFGFHPTCSKSVSAHVRIFSKKDIYLFYQFIGKDFSRIDKFFGSQFYPFSKKTSRFLSSKFPSLATSIFFLIKKIDNYNSEFLDHVKNTQLETNFYLGE